MQAMLLHIDRSRRPEGSLTAKDSPDVDDAETTVQRPDCSVTWSCASCPGLTNAKPRLVILTAGAVVNLAQGRNAASLGVIQGGSGIPIGACP